MITKKNIDKAALQYLRQPGVNRVFRSKKIRNGQDTGQECLTFGVTLKSDDVPAHERLPEKIRGIVTDVVQAPAFKAHSLDPKLKYRPAVGGISGCVGLNTSATLGGIVRDNTTGNLVCLTNNHAAGLRYDPLYAVPTGGAVYTAGMDYLQPSHGDGGDPVSDILGHVARAQANYFGLGASTPPNLIDAALIDMDELNIAWFSTLNMHAGPFPLAGKNDWSTGATVGKSGRTTGMTTGTVTSKDAALTVEFGSGDNNKAIFTGQILIDGAGFALPGDSGSFVMAIIGGVIHVVGLYFAGDGVSMGAANHIQDVANFLNISAWNGSIIVPRTLTPEITVNATQFLRQADTSWAVTHEED